MLGCLPGFFLGSSRVCIIKLDQLMARSISGRSRLPIISRPTLQLESGLPYLLHRTISKLSHFVLKYNFSATQNTTSTKILNYTTWARTSRPFCHCQQRGIRSSTPVCNAKEILSYYFRTVQSILDKVVNVSNSCSLSWSYNNVTFLHTLDEKISTKRAQLPK